MITIVVRAAGRSRWVGLRSIDKCARGSYQRIPRVIDGVYVPCVAKRRSSTSMGQPPTHHIVIGRLPHVMVTTKVIACLGQASTLAGYAIPFVVCQ